MKELFNILSSVSNFFNERLFVYHEPETSNKAPEQPDKPEAGLKGVDAGKIAERTKESGRNAVADNKLDKLMDRAIQESGNADPKDEIDTLLANEKARQTDVRREALEAKVQKIIDKRFSKMSPDRFAENMKKPSKNENARLAVESFGKAMKGLKVDIGKATTDEEMDSILSINKKPADKNTGLAKNKGSSDTEHKI